ncbi:hypothetical protein WMY93_033672 [Mugilogobius chulae]|uniref:Uncharacterized protein n=1 Tax=Mugilogobius chulae TaxID=88201 RepID=A0AAW0MJZ9_9GOBI
MSQEDIRRGMGRTASRIEMWRARIRRNKMLRTRRIMLANRRRRNRIREAMISKSRIKKRHPTCTSLSPGDTLVLETHWSRRHTGPGDTLVQKTHWSWRLTGPGDSLVLETHWSWRHTGPGDSLVLETHWSWRLTGPGDSLVLETHWSWRRTGPGDTLFLGTHCLEQSAQCAAVGVRPGCDSMDSVMVVLVEQHFTHFHFSQRLKALTNQKVLLDHLHVCKMS